VRLRSYNFGPTLRTRSLVIGIIAEEGRFSQNGVSRDRSNIGVSLARNIGPFQASLAVSRVKYSGFEGHTLFDLNLVRPLGPRKSYSLGVARNDIFESNAAVAAGITATSYLAGFTYPLASHWDLQGQATYYRYSDDNSRVTLAPQVYYRFRPTNPSLRVGLGYTYDNTDNARTAYYTPQNFDATSLLADYVVDAGLTRYGIFGAKSLTGATGAGNINRPADTLFGFFQRDLNNSLGLFASGGIVSAPGFHSKQIAGGVNLLF
jgi:hypothetical protein